MERARGSGERLREPHTQGVCQCLCLARTSVCEAPDRGGQAPGMAWGHGQGQGGARRSPPRHGPPRARRQARASWQVARSISRSRARILRVCHTQHSAFTHRIHAHTVYITSHKRQTVTHEYREELTRSHGHADKTRTHSRDAVPASLLCCSAHCHSAQGARTAWPPMAAHGGCSAARSAWRVARAWREPPGHGTRRTARGSWHVGGWVVRAWHAHVASRAA